MIQANQFLLRFPRDWQVDAIPGDRQAVGRSVAGDRLSVVSQEFHPQFSSLGDGGVDVQPAAPEIDRAGGQLADFVTTVD